MRIAVLLVMAASVASATAISGLRNPGATVRSLTTDSFEHDTQMMTGSTTGDWFVMFSTPGCPVCVRFAPVWEELAGDFAEHHTNIAKADCSSDDAYFLCSRFKVRSVPTLIYFKKGQMFPYESKDRSIPALKEFIRGVVAGSGLPIPPPAGWIDEIRDAFATLNMESLQALYEEQPNIVYFTGISIVLSLMLVFITIADACKEKKPVPPKKAPVAPTKKPTKKVE